MHAMKRPTQNTPICISSSCVSRGSASVHAITPSAAAGIDRNSSRRYQRVAVEAQDEREQIERQRHDPQQRHRGDVLRDVVRHREQQQRAGRGERAPQQPAAPSVGGGSSSRRSPSAAGAPCRHATSTRRAAGSSSAAAAQSTTNSGVGDRPAQRLRARRRPTARAGTDSRSAPASTRGSTARTADTDCGPG